LKCPPESQDAITDASPNAVAPSKMLIVDDNETTCKQLQTLLRSNPALQLTYQTDGKKALEELASDNYSVLITDLRMPGMDGMQLIKEIQDRRLPVTVIVTTGHGSIDDAVQAIRM